MKTVKTKRPLIRISLVIFALSMLLVGGLNNFLSNKHIKSELPLQSPGVAGITNTQGPKDELEDSRLGDESTLEKTPDSSQGRQEDDVKETQVRQKTPPDTLISQLIYPNSRVITNTQTHLQLTTDDEFEKVVGWYKDLLESMEFNASAFVTNIINGDKQAVVSVANSEVKIDLEIGQDSQSNEVEVDIVLDR